MKNQYVTMSRERNDVIIEKAHLMLYRYYGMPIDFKDGFIIR